MILVIDRSKRNATTVSDMLHYMGFVSYAVAHKDAFSELSSIYRAVIITSPGELPDCEDFVERLRKYAPQAVYCALLSEEDAHLKGAFDISLKKTSYASKIAASILDYAIENNLPRPGEYALFGVDTSVEISTPIYFFKALPFTKTENMILRYLIRTYPTPVSASKILIHAYRPSRTPDVSNIRTHISVINKKFRSVTGRNLIELAVGEGYRILNPKPCLSKC